MSNRRYYTVLAILLVMWIGLAVVLKHEYSEDKCAKRHGQYVKVEHRWKCHVVE